MQRFSEIVRAFIFVGVCLVSTEPTAFDALPDHAAQYVVPTEPEEFDRREIDAYYDWRNNLFFRRFTLSGAEGKADFMTARRTYKVSTNQFGYEVAVTFAHPLFYWLDRNGNGEFEPGQDEMWIDIEEDGVNGNEKLYDPMNLDDGPRGPVPLPPVPTPQPRGTPTSHARPGS